MWRDGTQKAGTQNEKRVIARKASQFDYVVDGQLMYKEKTKTSDRKELDITALVEQLRITRSCHSDPTSWHLGVQRALVLITEQFVRKEQNSDVMPKDQTQPNNIAYHPQANGLN
ncbi:hypothetical protein EMCRGX_G013962 [Ephydatia muelleri]